MRAPKFEFTPLNSHYSGDFDEREVSWLAACAIDKSLNIRALLGQRAAEVASVLEVGCGTGAVLIELRALGVGREFHGIDYENPHEHLDPRVADADIPCQQYDGLRLPFEDASIDLVYATHVLEHVPDEQAFLAEIRRVARRFVYIEVPCELTMRASVGSLQSTLDIGHIHPYTPESFALELCRSGLPPAEFRLFDHRLAIHTYFGGPIRGYIRMALRRSALAVSSWGASKLFCYHAGALVDMAQARDASA
jgi:SAM-dependent methyltransferase